LLRLMRDGERGRARQTAAPGAPLPATVTRARRAVSRCEAGDRSAKHRTARDQWEGVGTDHNNGYSRYWPRPALDGLSHFQQTATTARRSSLSRTVELFTLDARARISRELHGRQPCLAESVSPTERSSPCRSVARAGTVKHQADHLRSNMSRSRTEVKQLMLRLVRTQLNH
jgi:hypothetical protein